MPELNVDPNRLQECWDDIKHSGRFTEGKYTRLFEDAVSDLYNQEAVAMNSAGSGLYALGRLAGPVLQKWGTWGFSTNTFYATAAMPLEAGRRGALLDCNLSDFSLSFDALAADSTPLGVVMLTHVGGGIAQDYMKIRGYCDSYRAVLFEDAAHAFGVLPQKGGAGMHGEATVFSFYPTKAIPVGEGGIVMTRSPKLAEQLRQFRNYGKRTEYGVVKYSGMGFNFRMDEWTAAIAYLQVVRVEQIMAKRQVAAEKLARVIPSCMSWGPGESNWYKYPVNAEEAREMGIVKYAGKVYASTDQLHQCISDSRLTTGLMEIFPNATRVADTHVCLPIDETMYDDMDQNQILRHLRGA